VDLTPAATRTFNLTDVADLATVSDNATAGDGVSRLADGVTGRTVDFRNPSGALTVNAADGDDAVTLLGLDTGIPPAGLFLNGGPGGDSFLVTPSPVVPVTLDGGSGPDRLTLTTDGVLCLVLRGVSGTSGRFESDDRRPVVYADVESVPAAPDSPTEYFVARAYCDLLGRDVDQFGLAAWVSLLDGGSLTRSELAHALIGSLEYRNRQLDRLYMELLGRLPDPGGRAAWLAFFDAGGTLEQIEAGFLGSDEWLQNHGGTIDGFLDSVYERILHRLPDPGGRAAWTHLIVTGQLTRTQVAASILNSRERNIDDLHDLYEGLLRRPPEPAGIEAWLGQFAAGLTNETVIGLFVGSQEYYNRVQ
jgi:hypothetical protein